MILNPIMLVAIMLVVLAGCHRGDRFEPQVPLAPLGSECPDGCHDNVKPFL